LPQFLLDLIASPPKAGDGVHLWIFKLARQLHAHRDESKIFDLLKTALDDCGRRVPDKEIIDAVRNSRPIAWHPAQNGRPVPLAQPAWPPRDKTRIDAIVRRGIGLHDLWEASPIWLQAPVPEPTIDDESTDPVWVTSTVTLEPIGPFTEQIVDTLFPGNPLLCVGKTAYKFATRRRNVWRGRLSEFQFVVPSPMDRVKGRKADGEESEHTLDNTGPRRFLVVEFDFSLKARDGVTDSEWAPLVKSWDADGISVADACAALLVHLTKQAPLTLAVHSAGKSVHGWFYCQGQPERRLRRFMNDAHTLGADHATWTRSQFVRMPDGTRDNGRRQTVYFFNPKSVKAMS
jgi:hypothetical protein